MGTHKHKHVSIHARPPARAHTHRIHTHTPHIHTHCGAQGFDSDDQGRISFPELCAAVRRLVRPGAGRGGRAVVVARTRGEGGGGSRRVGARGRGGARGSGKEGERERESESERGGGVNSGLSVCV